MEFNPLALTAAKSIQTILIEESILIGILQATLLQIFCECMIYSKVIVKGFAESDKHLKTNPGEKIAANLYEEYMHVDWNTSSKSPLNILQMYAAFQRYCQKYRRCRR